MYVHNTFYEHFFVYVTTEILSCQLFITLKYLLSQLQILCPVVRLHTTRNAEMLFVPLDLYVFAWF